MASPEVVSKQLQIAGYADAAFRRIDADVMVGRSVEEALPSNSPSARPAKSTALPGVRLRTRLEYLTVLLSPAA